MSHWNFRVIEFKESGPDPKRWEIREVFYDDEAKPVAYGAPANVVWDSDDAPEAPELILERMRDALGKPVLLESETEPEPSSELPTDAFRFEKDPETGDLMLQFPDAFLQVEDWRMGDLLKLEVPARGSLLIENLSKAERKR